MNSTSHIHTVELNFGQISDADMGLMIKVVQHLRDRWAGERDGMAEPMQAVLLALSDEKSRRHQEHQELTDIMTGAHHVEVVELTAEERARLEAKHGPSFYE